MRPSRRRSAGQSSKPLALDGDLVRYDSDPPGGTELAVHSIASRVNMSNRPSTRACSKGDSADFAQTDLYHRVIVPWPIQAGGQAALAPCCPASS